MIQDRVGHVTFHSPLLLSPGGIGLTGLNELVEENPRKYFGDNPVDKYGYQVILQDLDKLLISFNNSSGQGSDSHRDKKGTFPWGRMRSEVIKVEQGGSESILKEEEAASGKTVVSSLLHHFEVHKLTVSSYLHFKKWKKWGFLVIISGEGKLAYSGAIKDVMAPERWFAPANLRSMEWINTGHEIPLEIIICLPV